MPPPATEQNKIQKTMKKIFLLLVAIFFINVLNAQDLIIKKNGDEINAKVQEVGVTEIKYKKADNPDGPIFSMLKSDVFMIKFENGTKEVFTEENNSNNQIDNNVNNQQIDNQNANTQHEIPQKVTVIIYRVNTFYGAAISYDLYANNNLLKKIKNNTYFATEMDEGHVTFSAKTESEVTLSLDLVPGNTYYLRCSVSTGVWVGIPYLELVSENVGVAETARMKK
jgi:hypothetical protein